MNNVGDKLKEFDQEHVLAFFEELSQKEKDELNAQVESVDFGIIKNSLANMTVDGRGEISPISVMAIDEIETNKTVYLEKGRQAISNGEVAAVLLAGGMGTRLGSDNPKGMYDIGITRPVYIFQRLFENLMEVTSEVGNEIHLFIMTSEKNNDDTINFIKEHNYFGYPEDKVHFFVQEMAAATDYNGKVYMESKSRIATSPNGNGGWYLSLKKAGLDSVMYENGIKWLNVFAVDNVLQKIADPCFVGATIEEGSVCGAKVIRKVDKDEKVGVLCLEDNHPSIIEYYELTDDMKDAVDEKGEPAYNFGVILNYLFSVKELDGIVAKNLPLHVVEKKIPYIDEQGNEVSPEEPNGYKYETLILDMIKMLDSCLGYEVVREKEFAPIKNLTGVDSVESARTLLKLNGIVL